MTAIMRSLLSMPKMWRRTQRGGRDLQSEKLRQRLQCAQVASPFNAAAVFVPIGEIKALIEPVTVQGILQESDKQSSEYHERLSATIVQTAPRLFALLVWIGQARIVFSLGPQYLDDTRLPLDKHGAELTKLRATVGWTAECEARILHDQWIFLAPVFQTRGQSISIPPSAPLPFISIGPASKETDNGTIRQVQIHPSHLGFLNEDEDAATPILALKLFKPKASRRFQHELYILQLLNKYSSRNIVRLLVAFSNQNARGLIFPWAECDLSEMMKRVITPSQRCELESWTLQQFIGLLDGLATIHCISAINGCQPHTQCRHGDIRPANILVMNGSKASCNHPASIVSCRLQIASMAMAQLFQDESQYTVPSETGTYQGPECYLETAIGPLYDNWSLGAIFLEMIIWWLEGLSGLEAFANERIAPDPLLGERAKDDCFFTLKIEDGRYVGAEVRRSVMSTIKRLERDGRLNPAFVACLSVIKSDMLVPIGNQRLGAREISRKIMNFLDSQGGDKGDLQSSG